MPSILLERHKERVTTFYRSVEGLVIPMRLLFDSAYSGGEKVMLALIGELCRQTSENPDTLGQWYTIFTNGEIEYMVGGISLRSLHRYFKKFRNAGLIISQIENSPTPNFRTLYLTPKGVKYLYNLDVAESVTMAGLKKHRTLM